MSLRMLGSVLGFCALGVVTACGDEEPQKPLEVRLLASRTRVEVTTRKAGECVPLAGPSGRAGCRSLSYQVGVVDSCLDRSCVREMRLEAAGVVLARSEPGRSAVFELGEAYPEGTVLVIEGCDAPIRLSLPAPKSETAIELTASPESVTVAVDGPAAGTYATLGSYAVMKGFIATCETAGPDATLPLSTEYTWYRVRTTAFDAPVRVTTAAVRAELFPSVHSDQLVSTLEVDATWSAAVALARQSSLYDDCETACAALSAACGDEAADTTACAVPCVGAGEALPACLDEYRARLECAAANASCETAPTSEPDPACAESESALEACAS